MDYRINTGSGIWQGGMFFTPVQLADKYLKLASEYQIKALLYVLSKNGAAGSEEISKKLGITAADAENVMDFWIEEGVLRRADSGENSAVCVVPAPAPEKQAEAKAALPAPTPVAERRVKSAEAKPPQLTSKEIVEIGSQKPHVASLLNEAQEIYERTISPSEQEMLVNLIDFYGLPVEVAIMLVSYCVKSKKDNKDYVYKTAKNWIEDGIDTLALAEKRTFELEKVDAFWPRLKEAAGFERKAPTAKQEKMILDWRRDFSDEMILCAADIMNENIDKPDFRYMDKILKNWKTAGIKTKQDVERANKSFEKRKAKSQKGGSGEISRKPTYDLEEIKKNALSNTDIKY